MWKRVFISTDFPSYSFKRQVSTAPKAASSRSEKILEILSRVRKRYGFQMPQPQTQYLISGGGNLDIGNNTQLILQSSHPVRYVIQREILKLESKLSILPSYHDWLTIFGCSLLPQSVHVSRDEDTNVKFETRLQCIGNSVECGMFSADIHQTILNIPTSYEGDATREQLEKFKQLNLGNKYAVLVGDYFSIRAIFFAEQTKCSEVVLSITKGVEDFTTAGFCSRLLDPSTHNPLILSPGATTEDWIAYNSNEAGYFTGGCNAILNVLPDRRKKFLPEDVRKLVQNLALFIKIAEELQDFKIETQDQDPVMMHASPFLLISLPSVLYQKLHTGVYDNLRKNKTQPSNLEVSTISKDIRQSSAIPQTLELMKHFGDTSKLELAKLSKNTSYTSVFNELIDAICHDDILMTTQ